jgi:Acetyltransferase (GNAT) domain/Major intrinsic protein
MNGILETMTQAGRVAPFFVRAAVPSLEIREGRYLVRFARTPEELDAALRLRFEVFNLELGEGLTSSFQTGRDLDQFDEACDHLIVSETEADKVIGTYRMQTTEMATAGSGFYTAAEFDLSRLPSDLLAGALVATYISVESPLSGMSMNPARTFGSAFNARIWNSLWIYFTAPPLGMLLAAEIYLRLKGAGGVLCAKLHHHNHKRCIFKRNFGSRSQIGQFGGVGVSGAASAQRGVERGGQPSPDDYGERAARGRSLAGEDEVGEGAYLETSS